VVNDLLFIPFVVMSDWVHLRSIVQVPYGAEFVFLQIARVLWDNVVGNGGFTVILS
jgi:hypothetical protein